MTTIRPFEGSLLAEDFLREAITELRDWRDLADEGLADLEAALRGLFNRFPTALSPNESQTEDDLIWPVLARLGWTASLRQQNLSARGREDVPDGLLFADGASKDRAKPLRRGVEALRARPRGRGIETVASTAGPSLRAAG